MNKYQEALSILQKLVDKQMPKKPQKNYQPDWFEDLVGIKAKYTCPNCSNEELVDKNLDISFCWQCGQKLDWSCEDEEDSFNC